MSFFSAIKLNTNLISSKNTFPKAIKFTWFPIPSDLIWLYKSFPSSMERVSISTVVVPYFRSLNFCPSHPKADGWSMFSWWESFVVLLSQNFPPRFFSFTPKFHGLPMPRNIFSVQFSIQKAQFSGTDGKEPIKPGLGPVFSNLGQTEKTRFRRHPCFRSSGAKIPLISGTCFHRGQIHCIGHNAGTAPHREPLPANAGALRWCGSSRDPGQSVAPKFISCTKKRLIRTRPSGAFWNLVETFFSTMHRTVINCTG